MFIIKYKFYFLIFTALTMGAAVVALVNPGLTLGIDFTGGSLLEVTYTESRPVSELVTTEIQKLPIGVFSLRETGESGYVIRTRDLRENERIALLDVLTLDDAHMFTVERFTSIGPIIGEELKKKAVVSIIVVIVAIAFFIAFAFRKVSEPVSSWKYGLIAIVALLHDVLIPAGAFVVYSQYTGAEVDTLFVTALLAILGYSINDTIVVFDRIRERLAYNKERNVREDFTTTVGEGLSQTYARSINTSFTTAIVLIALFVLVGSATHHFAFTLLVGVIAGAYSSIFLAAPLLVISNSTKEAPSTKKKK